MEPLKMLKSMLNLHEDSMKMNGTTILKWFLKYSDNEKDKFKISINFYSVFKNSVAKAKYQIKKSLIDDWGEQALRETIV